MFRKTIALVLATIVVLLWSSSTTNHISFVEASSSSPPTLFSLASLQWYYLGPFLVGKTEYDGNPLSSSESFFGGRWSSIDDIFNRTIVHAKSRSDAQKVRVPSEAVPGGFVQWRQLHMHTENRGTIGRIAVDHQQELNVLQQMLSGDSSALEFVGFAITQIQVATSGVYVFELSNVHTIFFNETPVMADQFGRSFRTSVFLPGDGAVTRLSVRLRGTRAQAMMQMRLIPFSNSNNKNSKRKTKVTLKKHNYAPDVVCGSAEDRSCHFYLKDRLGAVSLVVQSHEASATLGNVRIVHNNNNNAEHSFLKVVDEQQQQQQQQQQHHTANDDASDNDDPCSSIDGILRHRQEQLSSSSSSDEKKKSTTMMKARVSESLEEYRSLFCDASFVRARRLKKRNGAVSIPPLHTRTLSFSVAVTNEEAAYEFCEAKLKKKGGGGDVEVPFTVSVRARILDNNDNNNDDGDDEEELGKVTFRFRCRHLEQDTFLITYRDFDGSPAQAGVCLPLERQKNQKHDVQKAATATTALFPVVISQHGTGVTPTSQVDSFKVGRKNKSKNKNDDGVVFEFGVKGAFLIAPDRHGAHNWEGVGKMTALYSLFLLEVATHRNLIFHNKKNKILSNLLADTSRTMYTGHSMGSRGALVLSTQHPQRNIGTMLLALWHNKEHYGDSNSIFKLDRSTDNAGGYGSQRKKVIESSVADDHLQQLENLLHVPVFVRTGDSDFTVSPFFARRFVRMLRAELGHPNVTHEEPRMKNHWWWDTKTANDGGCMNDAVIRRFLRRVLSLNPPIAVGSRSDQQEQDEKEAMPVQPFSPLPISPTTMRQKGGAGVYYYQQHNDDKNNANSRKTIKRIFVTHSPFATSRHVEGIAVMEQIVPMERSQIVVFDDDNNNQGGDDEQRLFFSAVNVKKLQLGSDILCLKAQQQQQPPHLLFSVQVNEDAFEACSTKSSSSTTDCSSSSSSSSASFGDTAAASSCGDDHNTNNKQMTPRFKKPFGPIRRFWEAPTVVSFLPPSPSPSLPSSEVAAATAMMQGFARYAADIALVAYDTDVPVVSFSQHQAEEEENFQKSSTRMLILSSLRLNDDNDDSGNNRGDPPSPSPAAMQRFLKTRFPPSFQVDITPEFISFNVSSSSDDKRKNNNNKSGVVKIKGRNLVLVTIFPSDAEAGGSASPSGGGGLLVLAQTAKALRHAINDIGMPTVPPMMRPLFGNLLPDFFVSDADQSHLGYGSFRAGGYFHENFEVSEEMSFFS